MFAYDQVGGWKSRNIDQGVKKVGPEKSCWSYPRMGEVPVAKATLDEPSEVIHALSMLVLQYHFGNQQRTKVQGVSFERSAVAELVHDSPASHLLIGMDRYHRDLIVAGDNAAHRDVIDRMMGKSPRTWKYSAGELIPLLRRALDENRVGLTFRPSAEKLCENFPSA